MDNDTVPASVTDVDTPGGEQIPVASPGGEQIPVASPDGSGIPPAVPENPASPVLSGVHRAYLNQHAVSDAVIAAAGIHSAGDWVIFPWHDGELRTSQRRMWPEPPEGLPEGTPKYLWERGEPLHLTAWRSTDGLAPDCPVIIAEGTKQSLAVASCAPPEYAVYGMAGCNGWTKADLARFEGHQVLIMLDADAASNLHVYEAGERLAARLTLEGAFPVFIQSPTGGKDGIDDYLALVGPDRRTGHLERLITNAVSRAEDRKKRKQASAPADHRPARKPVRADEQVPVTERPKVVVNNDRLSVIREILWHMQRRWSGSALFSYGGVLTRLSEHADEKLQPLDKDALLRWIPEAVATFKVRPATQTSPPVWEPAWPEQQTVSAILASGEEFALLQAISRTPFARADGSICFKNGWDFDPASGTGTGVYLITGNSGMDRLDIPDSPSQADAAAAAGYLLGTWLGDMPWRDEASRANALALVLTPFIRNIVPLVPMAVVSGLQMGVGKNLFTDCMSIMTTGENSQPLPWIADDDDEIRKQILSSFRAGSTQVCFDEAHVLGGPSLTRAVTATTYADRILGASKMAAYPNRVTWIGLGNQVQVLADMARRTYYIELYPQVPNPQDRDESDFAIPDLRTWTREYRPELVTAALVMVRAWFAAGQPLRRRGSLMGSFEPWDKMMSGILGYAGVDGFLENLSERRAERDTLGRYWSDHLAWLLASFGFNTFTALDVRTRAMGSGGAWDAPPRLDEPGDRGFTRNLGAAYWRSKDRWYGDLRLVKVGTTTGTKSVWKLERREGNETVNQPGLSPLIHPVHPSQPAIGDTPPDQGGMNQMDREDSRIDYSAEFGSAPGLDGSDEADVPPLANGYARTAPHTRAHAHDHAHTHTRESAGDPSDTSASSKPPVALNGPVLGFDIETGDAGEIFTYVPHDETGFVRLAGIIGPQGSTLITGGQELAKLLPAASLVYGHNILGFDGIAMAVHHGLDWTEFAAKARDTELIARQYDPPRSRESGSSEDKYDLDHIAKMLGVGGKTDELKRLKTRHHGYDQIPLDDPEYRSYLEGDLHATAAVAGQLGRYYDEDPYLPREHLVAGINGQMSLNGFRVDQELLTGRLEAGETRKRQALQVLHNGWGLPLGKTVMRGRGKARHEEFQEATSPLATAEGRAWLEQQWARYQIPDPPRTEKTGALALGADELAKVAADPACPGDLKTMLALMGIITTTRTVYQTIAACLAADGRVHPQVSMRQASGRSSVTNPGLTVLGKRGGRHIERDVLIADEGYVLMSFDLSQVDMRGIAAHCQDPAYMALFGFGDDGKPLDAHAGIAAQVGLSRQDAKPIGHGWNYGLGPDRMIRNGMNPEVVYAFIAGMEARFPVLIGWREEIRNYARNGGILDNGFGRRMRAEPSRAYTVGPALMGQGTAADIMKETMLRTPREFDRYRLVTVHDEQLFQFPEKDAEEMSREVVRAMTWEFAPPGASRAVPILCDESVAGQSWGSISAK